MKTLDHFVRGYAPIIQHLEQIQSSDSVGICGEQNAKAKQCYQTATTKSVVKYACLLFDVLQHLSTLSCSLQRSSNSLAQVHRYFHATKAVLTRYKSKPGPMLKQIEEKATFEGIELAGSDASFVASHKSLLDDLLSSLEERLGDFQQGVVHATMIVDLASWPDKSSSAFGNYEIDTLVEHFATVLQGAGADIAKMSDEWTALKASIYAQHDWLQYIKCVTWQELHRKFSTEAPNVFILIDLVLSLPVSTAECEREFNTMKQIKNNWRSSLASDTINDLMTILLCSPDISNYNPNEAIQLWLASGLRQRRPNFMAKEDSSDEEQDGYTE